MSDETENKAVVWILAIPGAVLLIAGSAIAEGYVISVLWGWFVVPVFHLPTLTIPYALGFGSLAALLTNHKTGKEAEKEETEWWSGPLMHMLLKPWMALLFGWIVKSFI
jgi:hypothetical protein